MAILLCVVRRRCLCHHIWLDHGYGEVIFCRRWLRLGGCHFGVVVDNTRWCWGWALLVVIVGVVSSLPGCTSWWRLAPSSPSPPPLAYVPIVITFASLTPLPHYLHPKPPNHAYMPLFTYYHATLSRHCIALCLNPLPMLTWCHGTFSQHCIALHPNPMPTFPCLPSATLSSPTQLHPMDLLSMFN